MGQAVFVLLVLGVTGLFDYCEQRQKLSHIHSSIPVPSSVLPQFPSADAHTEPDEVNFLQRS
jgi:hypothetical protein